jgi:hypothetical protein
MARPEPNDASAADKWALAANLISGPASGPGRPFGMLRRLVVGFCIPAPTSAPQGRARVLIALILGSKRYIYMLLESLEGPEHGALGADFGAIESAGRLTIKKYKRWIL